MSDEPTIPETRESKRAIQLKTEMMGLLQEIVSVMECGRAEGFTIAFNITQNETGAYFINNDMLKVTKSW